jgi:hypothetical protein
MSDAFTCDGCGRKWPVLTLVRLCTHKPVPEKLY